jgi:hypothetical protein
MYTQLAQPVPEDGATDPIVAVAAEAAGATESAAINPISPSPAANLARIPASSISPPTVGPD